MQNVDNCNFNVLYFNDDNNHVFMYCVDVAISCHPMCVQMADIIIVLLSLILLQGEHESLTIVVMFTLL